MLGANTEPVTGLFVKVCSFFHTTLSLLATWQQQSSCWTDCSSVAGCFACYFSCAEGAADSLETPSACCAIFTHLSRVTLSHPVLAAAQTPIYMILYTHNHVRIRSRACRLAWFTFAVTRQPSSPVPTCPPDTSSFLWPCVAPSHSCERDYHLAPSTHQQAQVCLGAPACVASGHSPVLLHDHPTHALVFTLCTRTFQARSAHALSPVGSSGMGLGVAACACVHLRKCAFI